MKKENKREFDSEMLILPAIKMILTETEESPGAHAKKTKKRPGTRPTQKTVMRIIEALNKAD